MKPNTTVMYQDNLRRKAVCEGTKAEFFTDGPVNVGGQGEYFEPTTLVGVALGSCILTIMGLAAARSGIDFKGTKAEVFKEMEVSETRIKSFVVKIFMPHNNYAEAEKSKLEAIANVCPVKHSLNSDIKIDIEFIYP